MSVVIPCYNEEKSLEACVCRLVSIQDHSLQLEIVIVDDCSHDQSYAIATDLAQKYSQVTVLQHSRNMGKGAALRTGFQHAQGDIITVQDADLEYNPHDLPKLISPILTGQADVVLGSRYLHKNPRRVLYFWHSLMNNILTFLSNAFTDLGITDMECCYKVFRKDVLKEMELQEDGFGIEPELVARIAHMRCRVYELGVGYQPRTYSEGKKIRWVDGLRCLYCILHYNAPRAPIPIQILIYLFVGGVSALVNIFLFTVFLSCALSLPVAAAVAFFCAAGVNYYLCTRILFQHKARWNTLTEILIYLLVVCLTGLVDVLLTVFLVSIGWHGLMAKAMACLLVFLLNFCGRRFCVFPLKKLGDWAS